ncbi:MAG: PhzF family phenazine biosynthesis protein [Chlorobia bacterium]|nr:PhzF family phenazine biosynthesis protein [Fimbriimonadaceae bacterium]
MHQSIYVVDAFTDQPFRGNPAGVCVLEYPISDEIRQQIAMEMNHAETAFLTKLGEGNYELLWFTPMKEVKMCGHATLASAHVLWSTEQAQGEIRFQTKSGELKATKQGELIVLDFPAELTEPVLDVKPFETALGKKLNYVGDNWMYWMVELESEVDVRSFQPDLMAIAGLGREAVLITAKSESNIQDFVSRLFGPNVGIPEDPVTGSAHCLLAPYWSKRLGKTEMVGYQASERGGFVRVEFLGARVLLKGYAVTTLEGTLYLDKT